MHSLHLNKHIKFNIVLFLAIIAIVQLFAVKVYADKASESYRIQYLLDKIESSGAVFIRNGKEYPGAEARKHLQRKLDYAGDKITTAEDFITYIASKSSTSGEAYYMKLPDGKTMETATWLRQQLEEMKL